MGIILFRTYELLKLQVILCIFHVVISFDIYQTIHSFPNKFQSLPSKFGNVSSIIVKIRQFQVFSLIRSFIVSV